MSVFFPARTFYEDFYINFDVKDKIMTVHNDLVPVHSNFKVTITDSTVVNKEKTFIASLEGKRKIYNSTKLTGNTFTAYTKNLGQFALALDTIAPKISIAKSIEGKSIDKEKKSSVSESVTICPASNLTMVSSMKNGCCLNMTINPLG